MRYPSPPRPNAADRMQLVARACRQIEAADSPPALDALAAEAGLSRFQFHRLFCQATGLTPRAYAAAERARRLRAGLAAPQASVTQAIYDAGFNAGSRFYEQADQVLGMRPRDWRAGGAGAEIFFAVGQCTLGAVLVAQSRRGVCAIALGDDPEALVRELQDQFPNARLLGGDAAYERCVAQVVGFIEAPALGLELPLDVRGTAFQARVWRALALRGWPRGGAAAGPVSPAALARYYRAFLRAVAGADFPPDDAALDAMMRASAARGHHPQGALRQLAAILADTGRAARLAHIGVPTLVLHGLDDPWLPPACGRDAARRIPGARFVGLPGVGHDLAPIGAPALVQRVLAPLLPFLRQHDVA